MKLPIDRTSPIPLYHQIAEILRYRVATGRLRPGDTLPPVREAAGIWGVNLHTVRRAYHELAEAGLLEIRPPHPARVTASAKDARPEGARLDGFLNEVLARAAGEHELSPETLANLLLERSASGARSGGAVHVVECSEIQAAGHAAELRERYDVDARPWSLERPGEPPPGPIVATYFHYNDLRIRWPHRFAEIQFAGIAPRPDLVDRLPRPAKGRRVALRLCELDASMARSVAADLARLLPADRYRIESVTATDPGLVLRRRSRAPVLFPPRAWHLLSEADRARPRAVEVAYAFEPSELEALGRRHGWRRSNR